MFCFVLVLHVSAFNRHHGQNRRVGATITLSLSRQEIAGLNPDDAKSIREPRERNWPCSLGVREVYTLSLLSVTATPTNRELLYTEEGRQHFPPNVRLFSSCYRF